MQRLKTYKRQVKFHDQATEKSVINQEYLDIQNDELYVVTNSNFDEVCNLSEQLFISTLQGRNKRIPQCGPPDNSTREDTEEIGIGTCAIRKEDAKGKTDTSNDDVPMYNDLQELFKEDDNKMINEEREGAGLTLPKMFGVELCGGNDYDLLRLQESCEELGPLIKYLKTDELPVNKKLARKILHQAEFYFFNDDGLLCSLKPRNASTKGNKVQKDENVFVIVPVTLRKEILRGIHNFGHYGINRMLQYIERAGYRWDKMYADVRNFVLSCRPCSISNRGIQTPKAMLKPMEIPDRPGECLQIDIVGPFPPSKSGNIAVLTVIDRFSCYIWLFPLKACTSEIIAEKIFEVITDIGVPKILISDNAPNLVSKVMQDLAETLGIKKVTIAPYSSRSNGLCERAHRTFQDNLRVLLSDGNHDEWDTKIRTIVWGLRSAVSPKTKVSPFELLHGTPMAMPIDRLLQRGNTKITFDEKDRTEYAKSLKDRMEI